MELGLYRVSSENGINEAAAMGKGRKVAEVEGTLWWWLLKLTYTFAVEAEVEIPGRSTRGGGVGHVRSISNNLEVSTPGRAHSGMRSWPPFLASLINY